LTVDTDRHGLDTTTRPHCTPQRRAPFVEHRPFSPDGRIRLERRRLGADGDKHRELIRRATIVLEVKDGWFEGGSEAARRPAENWFAITHAQSGARPPCRSATRVPGMCGPRSRRRRGPIVLQTGPTQRV